MNRSVKKNVCVVFCSYLKAIGDIDVELSIPTKDLDVSRFLCFFNKQIALNKYNILLSFVQILCVTFSRLLALNCL